jgi:hypothetical protein
MGRPVRLAAAAGLAAVLMLSMTSASAATNPVSPLRVCGYGYRVVDQVVASTYLTVYLLRNGNGDKCVVALKGDTTMGRSHAMDVYLEVKNGAYRRLTGVQTYYLGPVRLPAAGKCVMWGGVVSVSGQWFGGERLNWGNCS